MTQVILILLLMFGGAFSSQPQTKTPSRAMAVTIDDLPSFYETFSQTVHARSSYMADEVVWNARFADIFNRPADDGLLTIDVRKLHSIESVNAE
jgi:hypothetical protein